MCLLISHFLISNSGNGRKSLAFSLTIFKRCNIIEKHHIQSVYDIKYHLVWITKYRKKILTGELANRIRTLIREVCKANEVEIIKGYISSDYVHLFVSVPPHISVSKLMEYIENQDMEDKDGDFKISGE